MAKRTLELDGIVIPVQSLAIDRAKATAFVLERGTLEYARLIECRQRADGKEEIVIFEVDVQRPQVRAHAIQSTEPIAIVFYKDDQRPDVLSLRGDFPQVPHLNLSLTEYPKSLCLYIQDWSELKARWTPARFVERIRFWLAETARGTLHKGDQPLEPLIMASGYQIVVPHDLFTDARLKEVQPLIVRLPGDDVKSKVLLATRPTGQEKTGAPFIAVAVRAEPQTHGVIRNAPANLNELNSFLAAAGCDLLGKLRGSEQLWAHGGVLRSRLIIVAAFPKRRGESATVESTDIWSFLTVETVEEVLAGIGRRAKGGGLILGKATDQEQGQSVRLDVLHTTFDLSRHFAARLNGLQAANDLKILAVGAGALGSKLQLSLARAGFGKWTIVDDDVLLPHNLAKHQYTGMWVGYKKATIARAANISLFRDEPQPEAILANVLKPGDGADKLSKAISEADVILDMSASTTVARHLASAESKARRICVFLNPAGTQLVLIAEDQARTLQLDALEFQFYRGILTQSELQDHLTTDAGRVRYAASCRDLTSLVPDDQVSLLATIGARAVRDAVQDPMAQIKVWKLEPTAFTVTSFAVPAASVIQIKLSDWTLIVDQALVERLQSLRREKLPNETGGVLLGFFDHELRRAYVMETIPSPSDSEEWPTLYIRGSAQLREGMERVAALTAGNVEYVGEWHSHPAGFSCRPSADDVKVFTWLTGHMAEEGQPALMAIVGDDGPHFFLGQMIGT